jgi:hypothetical protein
MRFRFLLLTMLVSMLFAVGARAAEAPPTAPLALGLDGARFWLGGQIESGNLPDAAMCDVLAPCPTFQLRLPPGGHRLRVAYDTPSRENSFSLDVIAPDGKVTSRSGSNVFDAEAFVAKPAPGAWTVRLVPKGVTRAFVRLRAKLEAGPAPKRAGRVPLLPNLKAVPPYEFGFVAPANPGNAAYPPDTVNPPLSAGGVQPLSCTADEMAPVSAGGGGAHDCLRLTTGPINVGDGPFLKQFKFASDAAAGQLHGDGPFIRGNTRQVIVYSDGSKETRPAGTYSFHVTHAHFHDDGILTYELFHVMGESLVPAGRGTKSGFCPADQLMGEWRAFRQETPGFFGEGDTATGNCYGATDNGLLSLTRGWGDVYRWQRPGQYVEWGNNGDGYYVVRTTVDKGNTTLETDKTDNSSYALIRVSGRRIELLERGQGTSHLDPRKVVFSGYGPASQDPYGELPAAVTAPLGGPVAGGGAWRPRHRSLPRVRGVTLRGGMLRFRLSRAATVRVTVLRDRRVLRRLTVRARAGLNAVALRGLAPGRYTIALAATDRAGNAARPVRLAVTVR